MSRSEWVWGRHPVLEALRADRAVEVYIAAGREHAAILAEIRELAGRHGVPVHDVPPTEIERRAGNMRTQGVIARTRPARTLDLAALLASLSPADTPFLLVLDQVQDPQNVGALIRTANAAGVQGVVLPERRSASLDGVVSKASAGALAHTPAVLVPNLAHALTALKRAGIWAVGLDGDGAQTLYDTDLTGPLALVLGSEGAGLRRLTREQCDLVVRLPMEGQVASLNVSAAGAAAMFEAVRQRRRRKDGPIQSGNVPT